MTVLTAPRSAMFSRQMALPFAPLLATKPMRRTGSATPLQEPPRAVAEALGGKPGGS